MLITHLLLLIEFWDVKPTYRKSWAGNLLMLLDLTLGPSFKAKGWFTGFGELSFQLIQFTLILQCTRSSLKFFNKNRVQLACMDLPIDSLFIIANRVDCDGTSFHTILYKASFIQCICREEFLVCVVEPQLSEHTGTAGFCVR